MTTRLLGLLCGLLVVVVATEVIYRAGTAGPVGRGAVAAERVEPPAGKAASQTRGASDQWMTVTLARPLFAPDRRPAPGTVAADPGMPRLTGIIAAPDGAVAIFQPTGSAKPVVAHYSERVGGWEVTAIAADSVSLRKENDVVVLSPRFDGIERDKAGVQQAKQSKTRWQTAAPNGLLRARWSNPHLQP
jgi:hypothetical protein